VLNTKQKECIKLMIEDKLNQKQIAEKLKVCPNTISNWKKDAEFMDEYTSAFKDSIREVAVKAFRTEIKLLNAKSEMVRLMAAKDILDRAGFKATDKLDINSNVGVTIIDDLGE
jgi:uncharacterized protein YjcR